VAGRVTRLAEFGAFVQVEPGIEGLVHASQTGLGPGRSLREHLPVGREVSVRVLELDAALGRLSLSLQHAGGGTIALEDAQAAQDAAALLGAPPDGAPRGIDLRGLLERALDERDEDGRE
jgi:predicted RNA-binding protein with RPS1 domain